MELGLWWEPLLLGLKFIRAILYTLHRPRAVTVRHKHTNTTHYRQTALTEAEHVQPPASSMIYTRRLLFTTQLKTRDWKTRCRIAKAKLKYYIFLVTAKNQSNRQFLELIPLTVPNGNSIGSAVFAGPMPHSPCTLHRATLFPKFSHSCGRTCTQSFLRITRRDPPPQTEYPSSVPFFRNIWSLPTDGQTDRTNSELDLLQNTLTLRLHSDAPSKLALFGCYQSVSGERFHVLIFLVVEI